MLSCPKNHSCLVSVNSIKNILEICLCHLSPTLFTKFTEVFLFSLDLRPQDNILECEYFLIKEIHS